MRLHEVQKLLHDKSEELTNLTKSYEKESNKLRVDIAECKRLIGLPMLNVDLDKVELAEKVLDLYNGLERFNRNVVQNAIEDIANGAVRLKREYFGTKDYDGWRGQEISCQYGYSPRHGYVVFRVGLKVRDRDLTDDEKDAAIYYLTMLKDNENFRKNSKGA